MAVPIPDAATVETPTAVCIAPPRAENAPPTRVMNEEPAPGDADTPEYACPATLWLTGVTIGRVPLTVAVIAGIPLNIGPAGACAGCALSPAYAIADTLGLNVVSVSDACCPSTDQPRGVTAEPIVAEVEIPPP